MTAAAHADGGVVCTIVARNYLGHARVLADSLRRTNPGLRVATLLVDGQEEDRADASAGDVLLLSDLGMSAETLEPMIVMYSVMELATALKPFLLEALLRQGHGVAVYLDPDIEVYASLDVAVDAARRSTIALTPHTLNPVPRDGFEISERTIMMSGMFNLGFIAVSQRAGAFLTWWQERLATDAVVDFENSLFTDQRWIDWVPALFEVEVLRDPGLNVAYWNAHERAVSNGDGSVRVGPGPLRFFHFSGFDPDQPWLLSRFMGEDPRVLLSESEALARLCGDHAAALADAHHHELVTLPYGFAALQGGPVLTPAVRRVYRDALLGRSGFPAPPANPVSDPAALRGWLETRVSCVPFGRLAPADLAVWTGSPSLRRRFPSVLGAASGGFARWLDESPEVTEEYAALGLRRPTASAAPLQRISSGWAVVPTGDPEPSDTARRVADRMARELVHVGGPWEVIQPPSMRNGNVAWARRGMAPDDSWCENVVVCIDTEHFSEDRVVQAVADRRGVKVAVWLAPAPERLAGAAHVVDHFDVHWALTESTRDSLRSIGVTDAEVIQVPSASSRPGRPPVWAAPQVALGPTFLAPVDASASLERQWPDAAVRAFTTAFDEGQARLVVLVMGGRLSRRQAELLRHTIGGRSDIAVIEDSPDDAALAAAVQVCAGVLAIQPSVMYNVVVADAAAAGTPVISAAAPGAASFLEGSATRLVSLVAEVEESVEAGGTRRRVHPAPNVAAVAEILAELAAGHGQDRQVPAPVRHSPLRKKLRRLTVSGAGAAQSQLLGWAR